MVNHFPSSLAKILLALLIAAYIVFFSAQLILHYHSFGSRALDLGNMGQSIWNTSQGEWFHQTNQPGATNRLSLHVEPILIPIALLYRFYPDPKLLFVLQTVIVALGALPVFALARLKLQSEGLALLFAGMYLLYPAIEAATLLDFHAVTLAPTFLIAAFYALETRHTKSFALFCVLAIACKEDITLLVLMMGLYAIIINRQFKLGGITVAGCMMWAFLAVFVIPPAFAGTENIHWDRYGHLGDSPLDIVGNMFLQPNLFFSHLQAVNALEYFNLLLLPTAYTALFNPVTLLLALPSLGINLLSSFSPMQEVNSLIYAAPIVPAIMISAIYGSYNLRRFGLKMAGSRATQTAVLSLANILLGILLLAATLYYQANYGYLPGSAQYRGWEEISDHARRAEAIFQQIPPQAKLSAQDRLNPHVSQRKTLYIFDRVADADHILLDVSQDSWPLHPIALRDKVQQFLNEDFRILAADDGYLLLAKNRPDLPATLPESFFDFVRLADSAGFTPPFSTPVTFDDKIQLLGYSLHLGAHEQFLPVITLYWRALQPLHEDYGLWPLLTDRDGQLLMTPEQYPLVATLWYPPSRWQPDEIIMTSTLPFDLAPEIGDTFTLSVGISQNNWQDPLQRLPVSQSPAGLITFDDQTVVRLGAFRRTGRKTYQPVTLPLAAAQEQSQAQFGGVIDLMGVDLPDDPLSPGDDLSFTLHWQAANPITVDLTTFIHLQNAQAETVAQLDWIPQDALGRLPTSSWPVNSRISDTQTIPLPSDLPPGEYTLFAGWYYAPTGQRLPLSNGGDVLDIGHITVQ